MANYPVFHGITLANGAFVENLHVERLASDPIPVSAGRIWYNTTQKRLKFSTLDATGAVAVKYVPVDQDLTDTLNSATSYTDNSIAALINSAPVLLDTLRELADAIGDDPNFANTVINLVSGVNSNLANVYSAVNTEITLVRGVDVWQNTRIDASFGHANAAYERANNVSDQIQPAFTAANSAGQYANAAFVQANAAYGYANTEVLRLDGINTEQNTSIAASFLQANASFGHANAAYGYANTEVLRLDGINTEQNTSIAASFTQANAAYGYANTEVLRLDGINVEQNTSIAAAFTQANSAYTYANNEVSRIDGINTTQNTSIAAAFTQANAAYGYANTEVLRLDGINTTQNTSIAASFTQANAAFAAANTAESGIRSDYNARRFTYGSNVGATTHTINHNLNSTYVSFTVLVERANGYFYNDIVSVEQTTANTLTVYLTEANNIKAAIESFVTL
ncbi:hypothetical protein EBU95_20435 [bacterium]|nr:hypothetical protein [bacterium]